MNILVINAGSSSVKFTCMNSEDFTVLASGLVERIGLAGTLFHYKRNGSEKITEEVAVKNTKPGRDSHHFLPVRCQGGGDEIPG